MKLLILGGFVSCYFYNGIFNILYISLLVVFSLLNDFRGYLVGCFFYRFCFGNCGEFYDFFRCIKIGEFNVFFVVN